MTGRVVTDSTCDIPEAEAARLGVAVIPAIQILEGRGIQDGVDPHRPEYYRRLTSPSALASTAAPSARL